MPELQNQNFLLNIKPVCYTENQGLIYLAIVLSISFLPSGKLKASASALN